MRDADEHGSEPIDAAESADLVAGDRLPEKVDLDEKAAIRKATDLFDAYGITVVPEGELEIRDYREMMRREPQIKAAVTLKILARLSSGFDIQTASPDPVDVEAAEFIEAQIDGMRGTFSGFLRRAMMAMVYGRSIHEIVLKQIETGPWRGKIGLKALKWKHPENFRARIDEFGSILAIQQRVGNDWVDLPPEYFVFWAWDHEGDYIGRSDLRAAYRFFKGKDLVDRMWNVHLEKFATPTPAARYPKGATNSARDTVLSALQNLNTAKALVIPQGWDLELLETKRAGRPGYEEKVKYCDRMMARAILLPTLLLDEGEKGARALGEQHSDNFVWVLDALGEELAEEIVEEQIIRPLVGWNFNTENFPKFVWRPFQSVDLQALAGALETLVNAGVINPTETWIREKLDLPPMEETDLPPENEGSGAGGEPAAPRAPGATNDGGQGAAGAGQARSSDGGSDPEAAMAAGQRSVEMKAAAAKFDHRSVRDRNTEIEDRAVETMASTARAMLADLKDQIRRKRIVRERRVGEIEKLTLRGLGDFRAALDLALAESVMYGSSDALDELRRGAEQTGADLPEIGETVSGNEAIFSGIEEPVEFATTRKQVVDSFKGKVPVPRAQLAAYGRQSYTVTGVFRDDILGESKRILQKGIRRSMTSAQIEAELTDLFAPYTETPGAVDPGVASAHRIHNIVRTNTAEAYNSGRMALFRDRTVGDFISAFQYSAIIDNRTTEVCSTWDGKVVARTDPAVDLMNPPNHYQCRSVWIPITRGEAFTLDEKPAVAPAKGFSY